MEYVGAMQGVSLRMGQMLPARVAGRLGAMDYVDFWRNAGIAWLPSSGVALSLR